VLFPPSLQQQPEQQLHGGCVHNTKWCRTCGCTPLEQLHD
jgi:hypothetical protein